MNTERSVVNSIDFVTIGLWLLLILMGWLNIYAAVYNEEFHSIFDMSQKYGKQLIWIIAAVVIAISVVLIDSKFFTAFAYFIYGGIVLSLVGVLLFGKEVNGARSWFEIGFIRIQPAEFAKFATCLAVSRYLSTFNIKIHRLMTLIAIGAIVFIPSALILLQNDTGSALVYVAFVLVLFREGLSGNVLLMILLIAILFILSLKLSLISLVVGLIVLAYLIYFAMRRKASEVAIAAGLLGLITLILWGANRVAGYNIELHYIIAVSVLISCIVYFYWAFRLNVSYIYILGIVLLGTIAFTYSIEYAFNNLLEDHQRTRINVLLGIEEDLKGAGYNVHQSKIAIGSGGFSGKGFLQGTQTKFNFVPEQSTDFIFCTIGEEWGFLGTSLVIIVFVSLMIRLIFLAERQRSSFSRIYGYGVASILFFHFAINIGMTIGVAPVIGIPLPFFSYGGSSLWAFTLLLFVFLRLDASRRQLLN